MSSVQERLTVKNMKLYLKKSNPGSIANKVKTANLLKMYKKCSVFLYTTSVPLEATICWQAEHGSGEEDVSEEEESGNSEKVSDSDDEVSSERTETDGEEAEPDSASDY